MGLVLSQNTLFYDLSHPEAEKDLKLFVEKRTEFFKKQANMIRYSTIVERMNSEIESPKMKIQDDKDERRKFQKAKTF